VNSLISLFVIFWLSCWVASVAFVDYTQQRSPERRTISAIVAGWKNVNFQWSFACGGEQAEQLPKA
jgi:hypothetical protein